MNIRRLIIIIILGLVLAAGCSKRSEEQEERGNVLRDYVRQPIERANDAAEEVEERDRKIREAAGELE